MISGQPQVCKLWLGVNKGMPPVRHQAPVYHKKEGAILRHGTCKHSLQYDGRPDGRLRVQAGTRNLGSQSGYGGDVCEEL